MKKVRPYGTQERWEFPVQYPKVGTGLFHNLIDLRVMNVADAREQMMFYLEVKPAKQPAHAFAFGSEINRGVDLVFCPFRFNFHRIAFRHNKMSILYYVRQLEYHSDYNACRKCHNQVADNGWYHPGKKERKHNKEKHI